MSAPPPSKPDRRVSRIRLSSQWVLCREGAALRLVPKNVGQTFGATQINCAGADSAAGKLPCGHSLRFFVRCSFRHSSTFLRPFAPRSLPASQLLRTALTPASQMRGLLARRTPRHWRVSLIIAGVLPAIPSPTICALAGVRPAASGSGLAATEASAGLVACLRPPTPTESSSRRRPTRVVCVTDWSFSFRCSPPRFAATQLRFDTARFFTAQKRTSTRFILLPSQAHWRRLSHPQHAAILHAGVNDSKANWDRFLTAVTRSGAVSGFLALQ